MKMTKVFVIPVVLLLFVLLPNVVPVEKGGANYNVEADTVSNLLMEDPYHGCKGPRHPDQETDRMLEVETHPAYQTLREKRPYTKSDDTNISAVGWKIKKVDDGKQFSDFYPRSIAVDASNRPHIAYGGNYLYYTYHDGSKWHYQTIDLSPGVGSFASIAIDTLGKAHICYYDAINSDLRYATNSSGAWVTRTVDSGGDVGRDTSLALDNSGKVHISYFDATNGDLKYATNGSGVWVTETVDSIGVVGGYTSLALDNSGK
ncbi:MAG: carboxypeptidase regulatory-like domain-containing protein, partial [Candidatus Brocadiaceae bacterium]